MLADFCIDLTQTEGVICRLQGAKTTWLQV